MNIGNKIKLRKAAIRKVFTQRESAFLFSIINITGDMSDTYDALIGILSTDDKDSAVIIPGYMYDEHKTLSKAIVDKIDEQEIDTNDIEEIRR